MLGTVLIVLLILMLLGALPEVAAQPGLGLLPKRRSGLASGGSGRSGFAGESLNGMGRNSLGGTVWPSRGSKAGHGILPNSGPRNLHKN